MSNLIGDLKFNYATGLYVYTDCLFTDKLIVNKLISKNMVLYGTTESTSTNSGSLIVSGGVGMGGDVNIGGTTIIYNTLQSNSCTDGSLVVHGGVGITGNVNICGDLNIHGDITQVNSSIVTIEDNIFKIANNNPGNSVDIGIYGEYNSSNYTGLFRDVSNDTWRLFKGLQTEPTTTIDITDPTYEKDNLIVGDFEACSIVSQDVILTSTKHSMSTASGALIVGGGVGIKESLNVGGDINITGNTTVDGDLYILGTITGLNGLNVQDEGVEVTNTPHTTLNFVGSAVTITDDGTSGSTINISGGVSGITVRNNGIDVPNTPHSILNFTGDSVVATDNGTGGSVITISGGNGGLKQGFYHIYDITPVLEGPFSGGIRGEHSVDLQTSRSSITQNARAPYSGILSGSSNTVDDTINAEHSIISGGENNVINSAHGNIEGGTGNKCDGEYSSTGGGLDNTAKSNYSRVGGGELNVSEGEWSFIGGGYNNYTYSDYSSILSGLNNQATGENSVAIGCNNIASGLNSICLGKQSNSNGYSNVLVWSDGVGGGVNASNNNQVCFKSTNGLQVVTGDEVAKKILVCDADGVGDWDNNVGELTVSENKLSLTNTVDFQHNPPLFECYIKNNTSTTTISLLDIPTKVIYAPFTVKKSYEYDFTIDNSTNLGRITYDNPRYRYVFCKITLSVRSSVADVTVKAHLAVNDDVLPGSKVMKKLGSTGGDVGYLTLQSMPALLQNDYLELYIECDSLCDLTISDVNIIGEAQYNYIPPILIYEPNLWLDSSDVSTMYNSDVGGNIVTDGEKVGRWEDKSGNNNHCTRTPLASRPTYTESDPRANNQPSVGTSTNVGQIGLGTPVMALGDIFVVIAYKDGLDPLADTYQHIIGGPFTNAKPRVITNAGTSNLLEGKIVRNQIGPFVTTNILPLPYSVCRLEPAYGILGKTHSWKIGWGNSGRNWTGPFSEVVCFPNKLSASNATDVINILAEKWDITI